MLDITEVRGDASPAEVAAWPMAWTWLVSRLCDPFTVEAVTEYVQGVKPGDRLAYSKPSLVTTEDGDGAWQPVGSSIPLEGGVACAKTWEWQGAAGTAIYSVRPGVALDEVDTSSDAYRVFTAAAAWALDYVLNLAPDNAGVTHTTIEGFSETLEEGDAAGFPVFFDDVLSAWGACAGGSQSDAVLGFSTVGRGGSWWRRGRRVRPVLYPRWRA